MIRLIWAIFTAMLLATPLRALEIQQVTSPGGLTAWLVEAHDMPFTALEISFRGGASLDAPEKRGAINLMTATLEEGAGTMDAQGFAEAAEALAAQFRFNVGDDTLDISARFLTENRDASAALLREALANPRFDQTAIDRVRAQVLSIIAAEAQDPNDIAGETFGQMVYGAHPYASSINGTEASVRALTREDLFEAKSRVMARDRVVISAVGDISAAELGPLLDALLADLPETGAPMPEHVAPALNGQVKVVDYDSPQSVVLFAGPGLRMDDPDFFAAYVLNQILGAGGFSSRLMEELREKRGLTYGVYSYLVPKDYAELWMGSFSASNEKVAEAIGLVRAEWEKAATGAVTEAELRDAKTYLTGAYPLRFDGNGQIAGILTGMQMSGLPVDYIETRNAKVEAVTAADIARVAGRLLAPDSLTFTVVGKPEGLK
jgi:zinc protease